jgi:hypothetical protein
MSDVPFPSDEDAPPERRRWVAPPPKQKPKRESRPAQESVSYVCLLCEERPELEGRAAYAAHVRERHPELLSADGKLIADRQLTTHLNGGRWHSYSYELRQKERLFATVSETFEKGR